MDNISRIKELIQILNNASYEYYQNDRPIMSDKEYDDLYDELLKLEEHTGIILSGSPTQKVQGYTLDGLKKIEHSKPMLSANKTKDVSVIRDFIGKNFVMCSYKMDGLTLVLRFNEGKLYKAITRGTGYIGEDVTESAKLIKNIPHIIPCKEELEIRGECVISWDSFNKINDKLEDTYSHPRNLAAGTIRSLDTNLSKDRNLEFVAFELVSYDNDPAYRTFTYRSESLDFLDSLGFTTVERMSMVALNDVDNVTNTLKAENTKYSVDGLIFNYESLSLSASLGMTGHHPLDMIALKWEDQLYETKLKNIEWSTSKTGLINPVAVFDPVDLDGAVTTRATLHNLSYIEGLELGIGDIIQVYRSNMVIPKVHSNLTRSSTYNIPLYCPCCGEPAEIHNENGSKTLHCINPDCSAKLLGKLTHAVSRNALNIDGLSEATIEKFISLGWISSIKDIYHLAGYADKMNTLEGFGKKSVDKLLKSIEDSRKTTLDRFIYALSIPLCGKTASKEISKYYHGDYTRFIEDTEFIDWTKLDGFGDSIEYGLNHYFLNNKSEVRELAKEFVFESNHNINVSNSLAGKTFVITGNLKHFTNRDEAKERIEFMGGKVSGSVSAKTFALVNNDINSNSGKNKKAKELGVQIITEDELIDMFD